MEGPRYLPGSETGPPTLWRRPDASAADWARPLATLAGELTYTDDPRRFEMAREAEELGRSLDEPSVRLDALERAASSINAREMLP